MNFSLSQASNQGRLPFEKTYLGLTSYERSLEIQLQVAQELVTNRSQTEPKLAGRVLGLEHPLVVTLGRRARRSDEVYLDQDLHVVQTGRGGLGTLHCPGQLVIYPVVDLKKIQLGVRDWVFLLLDTTTELLTAHGVPATVCRDTMGVFTPQGKIAFIGVEIKGGVSLHGVSLNVKNDLSEFRRIRSCGVQGADFDKMETYLDRGGHLTLSELFEQWSEILLDKITTRNTSRPFQG